MHAASGVARPRTCTSAPASTSSATRSPRPKAHAAAKGVSPADRYDPSRLTIAARRCAEPRAHDSITRRTCSTLSPPTTDL